MCPHCAIGVTIEIRYDGRDDVQENNLELWTRPQPTGIRAEDAVEWAQEILGLYAPELLNGCNSDAIEDGEDAGSIPADSTRMLY